MKIEKILEYQQLDNEIYKLEQELSNNQYQKALDKISKSVKGTRAISSQLEKEAENALKEYQSIEKSINTALKTLQTLEEKKDNEIDEKQSAKAVNELNGISKHLSGLERNIRALAEKVNKTILDYDTAKKNYSKAKVEHTKNKECLQKLTDKITPEIEKLTKELKAMEKDLDKTFLTKYKAKRQDKIFPVIVPLLENSCGRCRMQLPSAQIEKLKKDGFLECENCHRIIYFK